MATTHQVRTWWADYRCDLGDVTDVLGFAVRLRAQAHEAGDALDQVLRKHGYVAEVVGSHRWCPTGIAGQNCQPSGSNCSLHNYSLALDFDPFAYGNPHHFARFGNGWDFSDTKFTREQVVAVEAIRTNSGKQVWKWLGWAIGDTMHFEITCSPEDLATGINWNTVDGKGKRLTMLQTAEIGDTGDHIKALQIMLKQAGFDPGTIDGKYGPNTSKALLELRHSLPGGPNVVESGDKFTEWAFENLMRVYVKAKAGSVEGVEGPRGPKGDKGDKGDPGEDGADGKLVIVGEKRI